jgi:hypothetical protein
MHHTSVAVKILCQDTNPEHIDPEEHRQSEEIKIDQLHQNASFFYETIETSG